MRELAILGNSPNTITPSIFESDMEIWAMNAPGTKYPRFDRLFEMHIPEVYQKQPEHYTWLQDNEIIPVCMREEYPEIPMSIHYPFDEVLHMLKNVRQGSAKLRQLEFLTSTPDMAIALAIYFGKPKIHIYGMEMSHKSEYFYQQPGFIFWIGFAAGRDIELEIHCADGIFNKEIYSIGAEQYK